MIRTLPLAARTTFALLLALGGSGFAQDTLIREGDAWRFFRGVSEPPFAWVDHDFDADANSWETGATGLGYGDDDDATILDDMQNGYLSVYARRAFRVEAGATGFLILRVRYDDGFVAYIDGREVARRGVYGVRPRFDLPAVANHEITSPFGFDEEIVLDVSTSELLPDVDHVLAIQGHNVDLGSSDFSLSAELATVPFVVSFVDPPFGPVEGGNRVTIRGLGFSATDLPSVRFGDVAATKVAIVDEGLSVVAPPAPREMIVDVHVEDSRGSVTLPAAYRYATPGRGGLSFDGGQFAGADGFLGAFEEGTLSFWVRRNGEFFGFFFRVLAALEAAGGGDAARFEVRAGDIRMRTFVNGTANDLVANVPVGDDIWRHVAFTFSEGGRKIYLDGELVASDGLAVSHENVDRIRVGAGFAGGQPLNGAVESVSAYFFEREAEDIAGTRFLPVAEREDLGAGWPLDEGFGQVARDVGRFGRALFLGESIAVEGSDPEWVEISDFPALAVTRVEPSSGPLAGGNTVRILGNGFPIDGVGLSVAFGPQLSPRVVVANTAELTAEVPPGAAFGSVEVRVTTPGGTGRLASGYTYLPARVDRLVREGDEWSYFIATFQGPQGDWTDPEFDADDAGWSRGPSGLGYGDGDDATDLPQIQGQALTLYARREFDFEGSAAAAALLLFRVRYDDGFVAYLNGTEIARRNVAGQPPAFDEVATDQHDITGGPGSFDEEIDVTAFRSSLRRGANVLAIETHNVALDSSDLSISAELDIGTDGVVFRRGDVDGNGVHTVNDAVRILLHLFRDGPLSCEEAADVNDDAGISLTDAVYLLDYVFRRGAPPPAPFEFPGPDLDDDGLRCERAASGLSEL